MIFLVLAGCLLGFVFLVFGSRAFRWTLAFILFLPLLFAALFIYGMLTAAAHHVPPF
jgi:hypothetical protein